VVEDKDPGTATWLQESGTGDVLHVRRCQFEILAGPDEGRVESVAAQVIRLGRKGVDVTLNDRAVSAVHAELALTREGYRLRDLDSSNGTFASGLRVRDVYIAPGTRLQLGRTHLRFAPLQESVPLELWRDTHYERMVGKSWAMRRVFELIDKIAPTTATVLVTGETGTGKELVAEAIHRRSQRAGGPFVILDCSAIPKNLIEAYLFGHERGAFTGATRDRPGLFEQAHGGTLFLDEVGELPLEMQSRLLRAVETRSGRRIGGGETLRFDVRLVAATNRDLAAETNRGSFRSDLYYRLAVARIEVPPLRDRIEDVELLIERFADELAGPAVPAALPPDFLERAMAHSWPGNVRELRNAVEQALTAPALLELGPSFPDRGLWSIDTSVPFKRAKQQFVDEFDRRFMTTLLEENEWNIAKAARATGVDRMSIYKLLQRLGIERGSGRDDDLD
jgi:DNA-binding NtrC family response regulator